MKIHFGNKLWSKSKEISGRTCTGNREFIQVNANQIILCEHMKLEFAFDRKKLNNSTIL